MNKEETIKDIQNIINANCWTISEQSAKSIAKALYNAGYRKVPYGAVVLTPEERDEELKACNEKQAELENEITRLNNIEVELQELNMKYYNEAKDLRRELAKAKAENHKLKNDLAGFDEFARDISKTRIEITGEAIPTCKTLLEYIKKEKRNAVKEFAKKCKERINADYVNGCLNNHKGHLTEYDIDELIKEFTE